MPFIFAPMNIVLTLAVGDKIWGNFALNWVLSVKNSRPQAQTLLIYEESAVEGNEELLDHYFDHTIQVPKNQFKSGSEYAFKLKTELRDLVDGIDAENFLFLDADTMMNPRASVDDWFEKLKNVDFTMWCNDVYDFKTKTQSRNDYTFWCKPEEAYEHYKLHTEGCGNMPQVNSSFIYFKKSDEIVDLIFESAKVVYADNWGGIKKYKGAIPDELCFNVALAMWNTLPHQVPYYPIFFAFASENHEIPYIQEWKAFGFAGDGAMIGHLLGYYNELAYHYRKLEGIENWQLGDTLHGVKIEYLPTEPLCRRTIFRRGELPNSEGGVFNPDCIIDGGVSLTIFRKEGEFDGRKYVGHTAYPQLNDKELHIVGHEGKRIEDFRLFLHNGEIISNHTVCDISDTSNISAEICLSKIRLNQLSEWYYPELPIEKNKVEKNWMFFSEGGNLFCVYSLSPYRVFEHDGMNEWVELNVSRPKLRWFHDKSICNSTNPIKIGKNYLMFFHTKERGIYYHGAVLIDVYSKEITHYTRKPINVKQWGHGIAPNLIYVSGSVYSPNENLIRVFYGEGDESACFNDYDAELFMEEMFKHPVDKTYAGLDVQPIMIYVPDTDKWAKRFKDGKEHFESVGIKNIITVPAIYGEGFGIDGTHEYNLDNPSGHHKIGVANTALFLTMYMIYNIENNLPNSHFFFLEDDSRFEPDFMYELGEQLKYVPSDFDWLFIGHCCAEGKDYKHVGGNVYEVIYHPENGNYPIQYPMGGNAYIVAKKALPKIIATQRDAYVNVDISLALHSFMHLKVYVILPRICEQNNNPLPL